MATVDFFSVLYSIVFSSIYFNYSRNSFKILTKVWLSLCVMFQIFKKLYNIIIKKRIIKTIKKYSLILVIYNQKSYQFI